MIRYLSIEPKQLQLAVRDPGGDLFRDLASQVQNMERYRENEVLVFDQSVIDECRRQLRSVPNPDFGKASEWLCNAIVTLSRMAEKSTEVVNVMRPDPIPSDLWFTSQGQPTDQDWDNFARLAPQAQANRYANQIDSRPEVIRRLLAASDEVKLFDPYCMPPNAANEWTENHWQEKAKALARLICAWPQRVPASQRYLWVLAPSWSRRGEHDRVAATKLGGMIQDRIRAWAQQPNHPLGIELCIGVLPCPSMNEARRKPDLYPKHNRYLWTRHAALLMPNGIEDLLPRRDGVLALSSMNHSYGWYLTESAARRFKPNYRTSL
jgi:hypothetical protein